MLAILCLDSRTLKQEMWWKHWQIGIILLNTWQISYRTTLEHDVILDSLSHFDVTTQVRVTWSMKHIDKRTFTVISLFLSMQNIIVQYLVHKKARIVSSKNKKKCKDCGKGNTLSFCIVRRYSFFFLIQTKEGLIVLVNCSENFIRVHFIFPMHKMPLIKLRFKIWKIKILKLNLLNY